MSSSEPKHPEQPVPGCPLDRRRVLGTMGMAGIGWMIGAAEASAFRASGGPVLRVPASPDEASRPQLDVPDHWAEANRSADRYHRFLRALKLDAVDAKQVVESHAKARGAVWNTLPPEKWWKRMGYVLKVVDRIAREMNVSEVEVISAYRSPAYNARCRGAKAGSWHKENVAVDVRFPVRPYKVTAMARELRNLGLFRGGVGGYWNFTHIDARGRNVNW